MNPQRLLKLALCLLAIASGVYINQHLQLRWSKAHAAADERYTDIQNFAKVLNMIQQYYVEEVDTKKLLNGAIRGMMRELDPHTNYLPPEIMRDFENETNGEFGGLGVEISVQNGYLTVIAPIEDTPAYNAGVKSGDRIVAIDGKSTKGLSLVEASQLMRGKKGAKITLKVIRNDEEDKPIDIPIVRGVVKIHSVKYTDLEDGFAYIKVTSFIEGTSKDLEKALQNHQKKYPEMKGLVLDLRKNPGGLLDQAIKVSDLFLPDGVIVSTIGRNKNDKEVAMATKKAPYPKLPLVVLINEHSASASEIVAGALQDNKRALIVGERSFGKGSVQSIVKLGDGAGLKLTVARYYTPSGISIQAEGIKPDIEIEEREIDAKKDKKDASREKDLSGHLLGEKEKIGDSKKTEKSSPKEEILKNDFQLQQAFHHLQAFKLMRGIL